MSDYFYSLGFACMRYFRRDNCSLIVDTMGKLKELEIEENA